MDGGKANLITQILRLLLSRLHVTVLCVLSSPVVAIDANIPKLDPEGKLGIIGPSLASGTNSAQMCENTDAFKCLEDKLGVHDREWSHAGGRKSWSIASPLGFDQDHIVDASDNGDKWKDRAVDIVVAAVIVPQPVLLQPSQRQ